MTKKVLLPCLALCAAVLICANGTSYAAPRKSGFSLQTATSHAAPAPRLRHHAPPPPPPPHRHGPPPPPPHRPHRHSPPPPPPHRHY